ncbi:aminotransferase class I/II-fold pyridoxal phosphate-dependent enzyme [Rhodococcus hoagii]|nr:aminotransferase class I/II-fold pyridoxal phosphate-dependent enzyme [Prescottella equi]
MVLRVGTDNAALDWLDDVERAGGRQDCAASCGPAARSIGWSTSRPTIIWVSSGTPRWFDGAVDAVRRWGGGATGSACVTGTTSDHELLERGELASFVGAESGLVSQAEDAAISCSDRAFGPGCADRVGRRLSRLTRDACRLSRARVVVAPHADVDFLRRALAERAEERALVLTDSVFSADGDLAPLADMHRVCRDHGAVLLVDEAHGIGVRGRGGRGLVHEMGLGRGTGRRRHRDTVEVSREPGWCGTRVAESPAHLIDAARTFIFDTGLAPAAVGAARAALSVLRREPQRATAVLDRARDLARITGAAAPESAVVSVVLGDPEWRSRPRRPAGIAACTWAVSAHRPSRRARRACV